MGPSLQATFTRQTVVGKVMLTKFKKLTNLFLHTSNSHQITTHGNMEEKRRNKGAIAEYPAQLGV